MTDGPSQRLDLRIDGTGTAHPIGRTASQALRSRAGEWRLLRSPAEVLLALPAKEDARALRLAGEVRAPGGLCDVVSTVAQGGWGGELALFEEETARSLFFEAGNVVGATTNVPSERIGEILWRFGAISREQQDRIVREAEKSGKRIGDTAMDLGLIQPDELFRMMARQVEEVFYAAVQVADAVFYLFDGFDERLLTRRHHLVTGQLLMQAAQRMDELRFFREKIPGDGWVPVRLPMSGTRKVPQDLDSLLAQCDGRRSVAEIGRRTGQLEFEVTRALFQLVTAGLVAVSPPQPEGAWAVEALNRALVEIHRACDGAGTGKELRAGIAQFAMSTGVYVPLLNGAGPLDDGSLNAKRVAKNVTLLAGDDGDRWLAQQLLDYAGFALFHAGSLLSRSAEAELKDRVTDMLKPAPAPGAGVKSP